MIKTILPKNKGHWLELRQPNLNSTEVSALFGINPYLTLFELWHRKKDNLTVDFEGNERIDWGARLEKVIAKGIAEDEGWKIRKMDEYKYDPDLRLGSSFDYQIGDNGHLEIKNVDAMIFKDGWLVEDGQIEAPPHIEMQVQVEMAIGEFAFNYIGGLVGGNSVKLLKREPDEKVITAIYKKTAWFWNSILENKEPKPDFSRDADTIRRLYSQAEAGKVLDVRGNADVQGWADKYKQLSAQKKEIETQIDEIKSHLIIFAGDSEKIIGDNFSISMGIVKGGRVEYDRQDYRAFKPYFKKEK